MPHELIAQFCRVPGLQNCRADFFSRCQRVFREEVQPQLDEREQLLGEKATLVAENLALKAELETLKGKKREKVLA